MLRPATGPILPLNTLEVSVLRPRAAAIVVAAADMLVPRSMWQLRSLPSKLQSCFPTMPKNFPKSHTSLLLQDSQLHTFHKTLVRRIETASIESSPALPLSLIHVLLNLFATSILLCNLISHISSAWSAHKTQE
jgi:hypothetical protein